MQFFTLLVSLIAAVAATSTCSDNPAFRRFSFGGINGLIVSDGPAIFAENPFLVPDAVVRRTLRASFRTVSPLIGQQNVAIIDLPDARVMVDAGSVNIPELPQFRNAGRLISNMKAAGIEPESVDAVLFTHAHGDHVSGVTTVDGKAAFPNAMLYISRVDHEFWTQENVPNLKPEVIPNELIRTCSLLYSCGTQVLLCVPFPDCYSAITVPSLFLAFA